MNRISSILRVVVFPNIPILLTWNNLQDSVLLHVGRKVPCPHVLLHYPHIGQFLDRDKESKVEISAPQTDVAVVEAPLFTRVLSIS